MIELYYIIFDHSTTPCVVNLIMLSITIRRFFSKFISSVIKYEGELYEVNLKLHSRLSSTLRENNVPLLFDCEETAECGTCAICFDPETF